MPNEEKPQFFFDAQEIVEELIKKQGLHNGLWKLTLEIGLIGSNVNVLKDGKTTLTPAGIVIVPRIGIAKTEELDDLTVNAAEVNPHEEPTKTRKRSPKKKSAK